MFKLKYWRMSTHNKLTDNGDWITDKNDWIKDIGGDWLI